MSVNFALCKPALYVATDQPTGRRIKQGLMSNLHSVIPLALCVINIEIPQNCVVARSSAKIHSQLS